MPTAQLHLADGESDRKARGAFFTPLPIAEFLARWAIAGQSDARVLDPTSGEGVFLAAASEHLGELGGDPARLKSQVVGIDVHEPSLRETGRLLAERGLDAQLVHADFFQVRPPAESSGGLGPFNAVVGNPPFVRYQQHIGDARRASAEAALRQGVRLSGLASSWASLLVHAGAFVAPDGRLAMVLPAELLTVGYAEPVRRWLRERFAAVKLVLFERLQFSDALENVVLLLAQGTGGCDAFSLYHVQTANDLAQIQRFDEIAVSLSAHGKWTDLLLPVRQRQLFRQVVESRFVSLVDYGSPELGTVTGANGFFTLSEAVRCKFGLEEGVDVIPVSPPGTRHLRGLSFTPGDWGRLRDAGEAVWILYPERSTPSKELKRYLRVGERNGVPAAYKCRVRSPWWRPPVVSAPDLFFTYMSHRYPRLVANTARATFVNSMHGVRLRQEAPRISRTALPLLALNSVTMLGAELFGRSYGGGILKMEPREAASLPMPAPADLELAWSVLKGDRAALDRQLRRGHWADVVARVDEVLLGQTIGMSDAEASELREAAGALRARRMGRAASEGGR